MYFVRAGILLSHQLKTVGQTSKGSLLRTRTIVVSKSLKYFQLSDVAKALSQFSKRGHKKSF
jgi:hypothetical protein